MLSLNRDKEGKGQYRLIFEETLQGQDCNSLYQDELKMLKIMISLLAWVRGLKGLSQEVRDDMYPLKQD